MYEYLLESNNDRVGRDTEIETDLKVMTGDVFLSTNIREVYSCENDMYVLIMQSDTDTPILYSIWGIQLNPYKQCRV
jgi:hypothetical protein